MSLRKEAGLSSYNLEENDWLPDLASLNDSSISDIDPSPPYLRCKNCKGRLLRGVNSTICVFCGRQHNQDIPPDPIKFMSTVGSRWFLQSLHLDGSVSPLLVFLDFYFIFFVLSVTLLLTLWCFLNQKGLDFMGLREWILASVFVSLSDTTAFPLDVLPAGNFSVF